MSIFQRTKHSVSGRVFIMSTEHNRFGRVMALGKTFSVLVSRGVRVCTNPGLETRVVDILTFAENRDNPYLQEGKNMTRTYNCTYIHYMYKQK